MTENTAAHSENTRFRPCLWSAAVCAMLLAFASGCRQESARPQAPTETEVKITRVVPSERSTAPDSEQTDPPDAVKISDFQVVATPRIAMESVEHDFGEIGPDTSHKAEFRFTNTGTAPLRITGVTSCCGVTTAGARAGQVYAPGEGGVLEISYRAGSQPGSMRRNLSIQSNDPAQSLVTLIVKATIAPRVHYEPSTLKLFLRQDNAGAGDITLTSLDGRPFAITGFRATGTAIRADFDSRVEATEFVLRPIADVERLKSNLRGQISIDLTHPECRNVRILYDVLPEFTVNPQTIMLFNLKAGQPVEREIWILSNYQDDFEIESVSSQKGLVTLLAKTKIQNRYQLKLRITPPPAEGERAVLSDFVEVRIKDGEVLSIQCRGFY